MVDCLRLVATVGRPEEDDLNILRHVDYPVALYIPSAAEEYFVEVPFTLPQGRPPNLRFKTCDLSVRSRIWPG